MRLIDADRLLLEKMQGKYYHLPNGDIAIPINDIVHAPTVKQPEIIHCKDCMHNGSFDTDCPIVWNGKEYCSFAERR